MPHHLHGVCPPSLQRAINPTCLITGVFLMVFGWRTLTPEIPWAIRNTLSHLDFIFSRECVCSPPPKNTSQVIESNQILCYRITFSVPCFDEPFPPLHPTLKAAEKRIKQINLECLEKCFFPSFHFHFHDMRNCKPRMMYMVASTFRPDLSCSSLI